MWVESVQFSPLSQQRARQGLALPQAWNADDVSPPGDLAGVTRARQRQCFERMQHSHAHCFCALCICNPYSALLCSYKCETFLCVTLFGLLLGLLLFTATQAPDDGSNGAEAHTQDFLRRFSTTPSLQDIGVPYGPIKYMCEVRYHCHFRCAAIRACPYV